MCKESWGVGERISDWGIGLLRLIWCIRGRGKGGVFGVGVCGSGSR